MYEIGSAVRFHACQDMDELRQGLTVLQASVMAAFRLREN